MRATPDRTFLNRTENPARNPEKQGPDPENVTFDPKKWSKMALLTPKTQILGGVPRNVTFWPLFDDSGPPQNVIFWPLFWDPGTPGSRFLDPPQNVTFQDPGTPGSGFLDPDLARMCQKVTHLT